jgi:putative selenate reductase
MSDKFFPIEIKQLLKIILNELERNQSIFGIPQELFFKPGNNNPFKTKLFSQQIDSPLGVAAGPHSQMAQNIIGAWLMGARYIELKTIQTLDELDVSKPCIDMQDEGYNCEWSQELKIRESFNEYLNAWIIIHILNHKLNLGKTPGTIFNMSVGYNLEGIMKDNVQWFFGKMKDCSAEVKEKIDVIKEVYPEIDSIQIPTQISDNITLSTMHGCPANEIESIANYLLTEKKLHTYVKLNPTLLGPEKLREVLNKTSKFKTEVPDIAFEHDLKYPDAINIIKSLQKTAKGNNLEFGLKLTNTLESINNKDIFGNKVDMMYMSGRALHPISVNVANKLQHEFNGELQLSFSAGADAFNVSDILACGFKTITVCTDLLKPGGYMRFNQYFTELNRNIISINTISLAGFIEKYFKKTNRNPALSNLEKYAEKVLNNKRYKREHIQEPSIKTDRKLGYFDCISAPCRDTCATNQDIPDYLYYTSKNQFDKAYEVILRTNPFPSITGMVCDHLCQNKCTRINYDESLLIREVKRFISEQKEVKLTPQSKNGVNVAIIGAGPSGLSCAYYLALAGFSVEVFESKSKAGGMVQYAIPGFRLTDNAIERDFKRVTDLGVKINYNQRIDKGRFERLKSDCKYVFIGAGAQLSAPFQLEGIESKGVLDSLHFLFNVKNNQETGIGKNVVIIGGGNTAMDAARTAYRLVGNNGKVTIVYRRTMNEMPADQGEIKAVMEEGMEIIELTAPEKLVSENGRVKALLCSRMELGEKDASGRRKPVKVNGSEFKIECDTIIPAIGQNLDIDFVQNDLLKTDFTNYKTQLDNVFIGGDAMRGAATAIKAIGDGRKAAEQIMKKASIDFSIPKPTNGKNHSKKELMLKRAFRMYPPDLIELDINDRRNFKLISETLNKESIVKEADRCLHCDEICNICTTVCPNFANYSYEIEPAKIQLQKAIYDTGGQIKIENNGFFEIHQKYQILNIANFCNECGNCNTFCPTQSAPYKEKPKFWLTKESFKSADEGYYVSKKENHNSLHFKTSGVTVILSEEVDGYVYNSVNVTAVLAKKDLQIQKIEFLNNSKEFSHKQAVEMIILLKASEKLVFE